MATAPSPAQQEAAKFSQICRNCAKPTAIIEDHSQGDLVCTECGLVLESRVVDESSEWRTFSDSDKGGVDPNRTAGPTNRMLTNGGLGTSIGKNPDGTYNQTLTRLHNRGANPDRALLQAFGRIGEMADHLGMTSVVKDGACDIYRTVVKPGQPLLGKSQPAMVSFLFQLSYARVIRLTSSRVFCLLTARGLPVHRVSARGNQQDVQRDLRRRPEHHGERNRPMLQVHRQGHRRTEHADDGADDHAGEADEPILR